jgi:nitrogen regulatory protein PII
LLLNFTPYLVGRDFHEPDIQKALAEMGYSDIQVMKVKGRESLRLKYVKIN